jgi:ferredoxin-type protein NapH
MAIVINWESEMRSNGEKLFLIFFFPTVVIFYLVYKYPLWFVSEDQVADTFYWFGKSTGFWYNTLYTGIVCGIAAKLLLSGKTPYGKDKRKPISTYQKKKFTSIFLSQLVFFYLIPYFVPYIFNGKPFFGDAYAPVNKNAYVYLYNGFTSAGGFAYVFMLVPVSVWFFGKRYCSWFCACGNLAEAIGVTVWGNKWVQDRTPRGETSKKMEYLQYGFMAFACAFGLLLFLNAWQIISAPDLVVAVREVQDLGVDLMFGAIIGVGAYPILGTRIWCRFGCPLAGGMRLFGKYSRSRFKVVANDCCQGLNLCTTQCPMGIDVAKYAHENGVPKNGEFGLENSPCIGCGGCIDICPVQALSFQQILNPKKQRS